MPDVNALIHDLNLANAKSNRQLEREWQMVQANEYMTVGALRRALAEYHESDLVAVKAVSAVHGKDWYKGLYRVQIGEANTKLGHIVLLNPGDRYV